MSIGFSPLSVLFLEFENRGTRLIVVQQLNLFVLESLFFDRSVKFINP